jgi:CheY-like chemotaxis protein
LAAAPTASAQPDSEFYLPPTNAMEFWRAIQFEVASGNYELAAQRIKGLLALNPSDEDLLKIEQKDGLAKMLALRNVPRWSENPDPKARKKFDDDARKDLEDFLERTTTALKKVLGDPVRITKFARNLTATPEERVYAIAELRRSGAAAIPVLLNIIREDPSAEQRAAIYDALPLLNPETVPPLLAALDTPDPNMKVGIIEVLRARTDMRKLAMFAESNATPTMYYLRAADESEMVRKRATNLLLFLLGLKEADLVKVPASKSALTEAAEFFENYKVQFGDPEKVMVWKWAGNNVAVSTYSVSQAVEYYGLRYARWALQLDPTYRPAQVVFLSLAVDKALERAGLEQPLAKSHPEVYDLLASANPDTIAALLDKAIKENRRRVILAAVQALGDRAETKASRPAAAVQPALLVKALDYPDRRVQLAAAEALLRLPGPPAHDAGSRVVNVFRKALAAEPEAGDGGKPKVLIGDPDKVRAEAIGRLVEKAGYTPVTAHTGRDVLRRLNKAADIDVMFIDHELPYPMLPELLAQLRSDGQSALIPLVVIATVEDGPYSRKSPSPWNRPPVKVDTVPDNREYLKSETRLQAMLKTHPISIVVPEPLSGEGVKAGLAFFLAQNASQPLTEAEKAAHASRAIDGLRKIVLGQVKGYDALPAEKEMRDAMRDDALAARAIEAVGKLPVKLAQPDLAMVVKDTARPAEIRMLAADNLVSNIQQFGLAIPEKTVSELRALFDAEANADLKRHLATVVGVLRAGPKVTGERLRAYTPPVPGAAAEPAPKPKDKEPEKKDM